MKFWLLACLTCLALSCDDDGSSEPGVDTTDADGDGRSVAQGDCDDTDPEIHRGARDICGDGIDQDCNGRDADCDTTDYDLDGYTPGGGDCDDDDALVHPAAADVCGDGVDQDCDGVDLDCDDADEDKDGFSVNQGDCDDGDLFRTPGRLETCDDGIDQDCDGRDLPCDEVDQDGDGFSVADGDCDDGATRINPGAVEICHNGVDEDCDGEDPDCVEMDRDEDGVSDELDNCPDVADPLQVDRDDDGVGDVCDNCPATRNADQADGDGDGEGDACDGDVDQDGDGFLGREGDCDDSDPDVHPGAEERCNGVDDDCNGYPDDGCPSDLRSELVSFAAGESLLGSQDADAEACASNPGVDENCDEVPQRTVELSAFSIEAHEVTNTQYAACVAAGRCSSPQVVDGVASSRQFGDPAFAEHPVIWVNQIQAGAYCAWIGGELPTEAQWERAARGDAPMAQRRYPWGDEAPGSGCDVAVVNNCAEGTRPVTEGDVTAQGVMGLGGNVHEITRGYYNPSWYTSLEAEDPEPSATQVLRDQIAVRGGSYRSAVAFSTLSYRGFRLLVGHREGRPDVGFRCVR